MESYQYSVEDGERRIAEEEKSSLIDTESYDIRSPFAHDRDRVLHSAALRRLADKTQVVGPSQGDIPRNRLTHSLEVGQIAKGIGSALGLDPDLCEVAGLTHDIGHPPYGHNGEVALNELAHTCGGFEGNAQTIRILTRLEPKIIAHNQSYGLNLSRAVLDATCKYPWTHTRTDGSHARKYSCYDEDKEIFQWIRKGQEHNTTVPIEGQVMDWSDDIAYSVHDVEDGIRAGRINFDVLWDLVELNSIAHTGARLFGGSAEELLEAAGRLNKLDLINKVHNFDNTLGSLVALKKLTSGLVGRFINATVSATRRENEEYIARNELGRHNGHISVPDSIKAEVRLLKTLAVLYVMEEPQHLRQQERQRDRIYSVYEYLCRSAPGSLDPLYAQWYVEAQTEQEAQRVIIDQIASLTESRLERIALQAAHNSSPFN